MLCPDATLRSEGHDKGFVQITLARRTEGRAALTQPPSAPASASARIPQALHAAAHQPKMGMRSPGYFFIGAAMSERWLCSAVLFNAK